MSTILERIRAHGGIRAIHVVPFTGRGRKVLGWHNIVVCADGTRLGLTREDEEMLQRCPR